MPWKGQLLPAACPWRGHLGPVALVFWACVVPAWGPGTNPAACALARWRWALWGWQGGLSREVPRAFVRGARGPVLILPRLPVLAAGSQGPLPTCCGRRRAGVQTRHGPFGVCVLSVVAGPRGGGRLFWGEHLPPLRGASGVRRSPSRGCPSLGRVAGARYPCSLGVDGAAVGTQHRLAGRGDSPGGMPRAVVRNA